MKPEKNRTFALLLCLLLCIPLFAGCVQKKPEDLPEELPELTYADALPETDLPRPGRVIESVADFVYALDYLAFYRIDRTVAFEIGEPYAASFYGIYPEFSRICGITELADVYPVSMEQKYYDPYRVILISLRSVSVADQKTEDAGDMPPFLLPFDYDPELHARGEDFNEFPLYRNNNGTVSVENGEQLWYAVEHGYCPVPVADSAAQTLWEEAQRILRRIVSDDMSDYDICKAIYQFLTCEVRYDSDTANAASADSARHQSYYLEGVLLNRYAVCDGKAKAYCLLAGMEGIPVVRVTDFKNRSTGHAYNYAKVQGEWYLSCSTFGASVLDFGTDEKPMKRIVPQYQMFLTSVDTPLGEKWGYDSMMYPDIKASIGDRTFDYWGYTGIDDRGETRNLVVSSADELQALLNAICGQIGTLANRIVEFRIPEGTDFSIEEISDAISAAYPQYEVYFLQSRPLERTLFSIVFLA